ncbi:MAG: hypothetical protein WAW92_03550 [Minisyncoccia bacterium]
MAYVFFLGGQDLEMLTIRKLLEENNQEFFDRQLKWGAKASDYPVLMNPASFGNGDSGKMPVLVELDIDGGPLPYGAIVVDHHNNRSGELASILQVFKLLGIEPTREHLLIAANDSGYIPAMLHAGATSEEIADIRRLDREAQGVTVEMEIEAEDAIYCRTEDKGVVIVQLPHNKVSAVTDRMFTSWPDGRENLVVVCKMGNFDYEVYYFGRGDICRETKEMFNGFGGGTGFGDPAKNAFAGCKTKTPVDVINFVVGRQ